MSDKRNTNATPGKASSDGFSGTLGIRNNSTATPQTKENKFAQTLTKFVRNKIWFTVALLILITATTASGALLLTNSRQTNAGQIGRVDFYATPNGTVSYYISLNLGLSWESIPMEYVGNDISYGFCMGVNAPVGLLVKAEAVDGYIISGYTIANDLNYSKSVYDKAWTFSLTGTYSLVGFTSYAAECIDIIYSRGDYGVGTLPNNQFKLRSDYSIWLSNSDLTRAGYSQIGWGRYEQTLGIGMEPNWDSINNIRNGEEFIGNTPNSSITFYPIWQQNPVFLSRIKLVANGGGGMDHIIEGEAGTRVYDTRTTVTIIHSPPAAGYTFSGYFTGTNSNGTRYINSDGSVVNSSSVIFPSSSGTTTTLYAGWAAPTYKVTYNQGSSSTPKPADQTKTHDVPLTLSNATLSFTGYTHTGWHTDYSEWYYATSTPMWNTSTRIQRNGNYTENANAHFFPVWQANSYTVTLNQQSGSGGTSSVTAYYEYDMPSITIPQRQGFSFLGYYTSTGGGGTQYYTSSGTSYRPYNLTSGTTLHAAWANNYTVTFNSNGGTSVGSQTIISGGKVSKPTNPTKTDYTFDKWCKDSALTTEWNFSTDTVTSNITLYAKWTQAGDYNQVRTFLELKDLSGTSNAQKHNITDLNNTSAWSPYFVFNASNRLTKVKLTPDPAWHGSLDLSNCIALTEINAFDIYYKNSLTELNVSGCTSLTKIYCDYDQLTTLNASGCTSLEILRCDNNKLTTLNVSGCTNLKELFCGANKLTTISKILGLSDCKKLTTLFCGGNQMTGTLNLSNFTALTNLSCNQNELEALTNLPASLTELVCSTNKLTTLDASNCTFTGLFVFGGNNFTSLKYKILKNSITYTINITCVGGGGYFKDGGTSPFSVDFYCNSPNNAITITSSGLGFTDNTYINTAKVFIDYSGAATKTITATFSRVEVGMCYLYNANGISEPPNVVEYTPGTAKALPTPSATGTPYAGQIFYGWFTKDRFDIWFNTRTLPAASYKVTQINTTALTVEYYAIWY